MGPLFKKTIMSQAWKETSLKVQRPGNEAKGNAKAGNFPTSALDPRNRIMIWPGLGGDVESRDKKLDRYLKEIVFKVTERILLQIPSFQLGSIRSTLAVWLRKQSDYYWGKTVNSETKIPWKVKKLKSLYLRNAYSLNLEREYNAGTSLRHPYGMKMYAELARKMKRKKLGIKSLNDNIICSKHEIVMNGYLGNILGTQISMGLAA